jgi:hypothetical protein
MNFVGVTRPDGGGLVYGDGVMVMIMQIGIDS